MSEYEKIIENINPTIQDVIKDIDDNKMDIFRAGIYADTGEQFISSYQVKKVLEHLANPTLNPNQQVVLEWLKEKHINNHNSKDKAPLLNFTEFGWRHFDCTLPNKVEDAYRKLNTIEDAQVLQVFSAWVREQEGE